MPGPTQRPDSNPWRFLVSDTLAYAGVDQGVDFTGSGNVFAPADAIVTRVERGGSGWPGEGAVLNLKLISGPKAGSYVYVAEDFAPRSDLVRGKVVRHGETIGQATGSGKAPGIEVGWAQPSGIPLAPRPPARPADQFTPQGADFAAFIRGGAGGGGGSIVGSVTGAVGDAAGAVNSAARHIPGVAQVEGAAGAVTGVADFLGKLTDPSYILRGLQIIAGAVLVLVGLALLVRQVALAADLPDPLAAAASAASKAPIVPVE